MTANQINQSPFNHYYQAFAKRHGKGRTHILKLPKKTKKCRIGYQVQSENP